MDPPRSKRRRTARIALTLVVLGVIAVLVAAAQIPQIREWACYEAEVGPLDGEWGLSCERLIKRFDFLPGPNCILRLHTASQELVLEQQRPRFAWIQVDEVLLIIRSRKETIELTIGANGIATLEREPSANGGSAVRDTLKRDTLKILDGAGPELARQPLSELLKKLRSMKKIDIGVRGLPPEIGKKKVLLDSGKLGESLRKSLAAIDYTWGIRPSGEIQLIPAADTPSDGKPRTFKSVEVRLAMRTIATQPVNFEFNAWPMGEIMKFFSDITGLRFIFHEAALSKIKFTCKTQGTTIAEFMTEGLQRGGVRFFFRPDGGIAVLR